jgi:exosortase
MAVVESVPVRSRVARQWGSVLALVLSVGALWLLCSSTLLSLFERWSQWDESYSHGWLILALSLFLAVRAARRTALEGMGLWSIPLLAMALAVWIVSDAVNIIIVQQLLIPVMLWLMLGLAGGWRFARAFSFTAAFIYLAIPIWDYLTPLLVGMTVSVVALWVALLDIPLLIEGVRISLPSGHFVVADGCSGLRYFVVALAFSVLYAKLYARSIKTRFAIVVSGIAVGLVANWIRVFSLVLIGHTTQMQSPLMKEHDYFGLWVFAACLFIFIFVLGRLLPALPDAKEPEPSAVMELDNAWKGSPWTNWAGLTLTIAVSFVMVHVSSAQLQKLIPAVLFERQVDLPKALQPSLMFAISDRVMSQQSFRVEGSPMAYLLVNHYSREQSKQDFLPYRTWFNKQQWMILDEALVAPAVSDVETMGYLQLEQRQSHDRWNLIYWFEVGARVSSNQYEAKLLELPALMEQRQDARLVMIAQLCRVSCEQERSDLLHLIDANFALQPQRVRQGGQQ